MQKSKLLAHLEALFAVVIILGAAVLLRKQFAFPARSDLAFLALLGFIGVTFHQWLQATGLQTAQATTTAWIVASTPVFIAILGWLVLKEKFGWVRILGIVLAAAGVLLVVSKGNLSGLFSGKEGTVGDILIFISAINWAVYTVLSRRELSRHPAARMMFYVMLFGWLFTTLWIFGLGPGMSELGTLSARAWAAILVLGIFGSGLAYIAYYDALQALPASQLGAFLNIEPLVTTLMAAAMIGEAITAITLFGGAIILLGVYLVNRRQP